MIDARDEHWLSTLLPQAVELARQAGSAVMRAYSELNPAVEYKRDQSPLTQADLASHRILVQGLDRITPGWPVLSEESAEVPFEQRRVWPRFWLVDPLDGTKEFLQRNGEFTVNIALIEGARPVLGVVAAPAAANLAGLYYAARGLGAWKEHAGAWKEKASPAAPIRVSPAPAAKDDPIRIVVSRSHSSSGEDLSPWTESRPHTCIPMGSSLKFCLVAEGAADIYPRLGPTMEWDTAAAQCILEVAGGRVTDLDGNPLLYNKPSLLNPGFVARGDGEIPG